MTGTVQDINVTVPVAANVIANVCGLTVPVSVLARTVIVQDREFTCEGCGGQALAVRQRLAASHNSDGPSRPP